jgi:hypothetical protein
MIVAVYLSAIAFLRSSQFQYSIPTRNGTVFAGTVIQRLPICRHCHCHCHYPHHCTSAATVVRRRKEGKDRWESAQAGVSGHSDIEA